MRSWRRQAAVLLVLAVVVSAMPGCGYRGLNSLPLPGTQGSGPGSYRVQVQMADVRNLQSNAVVRVDDVPVGHVANIELQGWHALLTLQLDGDVDLPANASAKIGQSTLLGSLHIELAAPTKEPPHGKLRNGAVIPLSHTSEYPTVEQTLASVALVLNGGGLAQVQDITDALSTAFRGREGDFRSLITQLDIFTANLQGQTSDVIAASDAMNRVLGKFAAQQPVLDRAVRAIPNALKTLDGERDHLVEATNKVGEFSGLAAGTITASKENLVKELRQVGPVLKSFADVGPDLAYTLLGFYETYPFPNETIDKWMRGDSGNLTAIIDLTLSRIDSELFTGTRYECNLTALELQWGRTVGQFPSPCLNPGAFGQSNPIAIPYNGDQGP